MKKIIVFTLFSAIMVLSSCIRQDDFSFRGIEAVTFESLSNVSVTVGVENRSGGRVSIESAKFRLDNCNRPTISMLLRDRVVIEKRSANSVKMNWSLKLDNPLAAFSAIAAIKRSPSDLTVSGEVVVKKGWIRKKIEVDSVPLSQILVTFGADKDDVIKLFEL